MNLFDVVGGRQEIDSSAATQGVNVGQRLGGLSSQAGPAAFALDVIKAKQVEDSRRAALAVEQQKARVAGLQRILLEGSKAPEGSEAKKAYDALSTNPMALQVLGVDPSKNNSSTNIMDVLKGMTGGDSGLQLDSVDSTGKAVFKNPKNSASFLENKQKAISEAIDEIENLKLQTNRVAEALTAAEKVTGGLQGKIERGAMKMFDPNNPMLGEWQKVKSILTDTQMLYTAKTKGAISDREMELFAKAAANDDMASLPAIKVALADVLNRLQASTNSATSSVKKNFGEDLSGMLGSEPAMFDADKEARYQAWKKKQGV